MILLGIYILSCLVASVVGCHRGENGQGPTAAPQPRFEVHHDPIADIWLGELEFVNLFCGTDSFMPSIFSRILRRSVDQDQAADLTPEELNKYKLDHSLLYFRGQAYEWGAGLFMNKFINGTVNRNPVACNSAITWTLQERSNCTADEAQQMAHSYHLLYGQYALLTNNCHHFVERFVQKLRNGDCTPFYGSPSPMENGEDRPPLVAN